jgi:demethylmenaquinone methyltransferase/2-methoxy-6-polyprenyl-1,4-benzoquinol methylase
MNATLVEENLVTTSKTLDKSGDKVREMFAQIAPRYDLLNHVLSLNIDKRWRAKTLRLLDLKPGIPVLDVCTGTGDLALAIATKLGPDTNVVGTDFCAPMLEIARTKQSKMVPTCEKLQFLEADTQELPFPDDHFQCVSVAFGLRNVADTMAGLREMIRVTQPGGKLPFLSFQNRECSDCDNCITLTFCMFYLALVRPWPKTIDRLTNTFPRVYSNSHAVKNW